MTTLLVVGCGCCEPPPFPQSPPLAISSVEEDNSGAKYFVKPIRGQYVYEFFKWDATVNLWKKTVNFNDPNKSLNYEFYVDTLNPTANSFFLYDANAKKLINVDALSGTANTQQMADNYSIISADEFAVYQAGNQVWTHQVSTGAMTYLHNLPSLAAVNAGLSLNIADVTQYQMLCTPELIYKQWDYQSHYCIMANAVTYPNTPKVGSNNNSVYEMNITLNPNGTYAYTLLRQYTNIGSVVIHEHNAYPDRIELQKKYPWFVDYLVADSRQRTSSLSLAFSIDKKGGLNYFNQLTTSSQVTLSYTLITQASLPLGLYNQVIP